MRKTEEYSILLSEENADKSKKSLHVGKLNVFEVFQE